MDQTRWPCVLLLYGVGLIASSFLGKVAPIGPLLQRDLGLSLAQLGWMVSTITGVAGVLGAAVGFWLAGSGARRALLLGLVILAGSGMLTAAGSDAKLMIAARVGEGVGYLLVVVAAPTLIVRLSRGARPGERACAVGHLHPGRAGDQRVCRRSGRGCDRLARLAEPDRRVAGAGVSFRDHRDSCGRAAGATPGRRIGSIRRASSVGARGAFGCIGLIGVVVIALLPTFLVEVRAATLSAAGGATALVSLASVPGSLLAGWLMRYGAGLRALSLCSLLMPAAGLVAFASGGPVGLGVAAAAAILFANGVVVSAMFAAVPYLAGHPAGVALGNGLIAQLGSLGTLLGPPLFGAGIAAAGWHASPGLILAFTLLGLVLARIAVAVRR